MGKYFLFLGIGLKI